MMLMPGCFLSLATGDRMAEKGKGEARRILLVEDNPDDEALTIRALKKHNLLNDVTVARDGTEALECLLPRNGSDPVKYALVLLDLKLPKVDGLEVLRAVRSDERTRLTPIVILTSSKEQEDILASYTHGANAYVRKPVSFAEFSDAISTLGLFWLILNQPAPDLTPLGQDLAQRGGQSRGATPSRYQRRTRRRGQGLREKVWVGGYVVTRLPLTTL